MTAFDRISAAESQPSGRLLETPFEIAARIVETIGPRSPGSISEAKMAAFLDARLRNAGFRLSAEPCRALRLPGYDGMIAGILAVAGVVCSFQAPLLATLIFAAIAGAALVSLLYDTPLLTPHMLSQNVVATRAAAGMMRWRLVVLAPLSSPPAVGRWLAAIGDGLTGRISRAVAAAALLALGVAASASLSPDLRMWLWYAQAALAITLLAQGGAALIVQHAPATPGAISYAGALATLIESAARLPHLQHTEVWMVGVGAGASTAGIDDLLRRYPFEPQHAVFLSLDGIGNGTLCYLAAEGALRLRPADSLLVRLADCVINSGQATAKSCVCRCTTYADALRRRGWRALGIASLDAQKRIPYRHQRDDDLSKLDADHLDNAVRLVVGLARALDATP